MRIAIIYQVASYWPSIESFYQACLTDEKVDVQIFYIDDMSVEKAQVEGSDLFLAENGISYMLYSENRIREYKPHVALYQPSYDVSYRNPSALSLHVMNMGVRIIYIPYGIEISDTEDAHYNHFFTFVIRNSWRIYTFSDTMKEEYFRYCPNRHAVRAVGLPKLDSLFYKNIPPNKEILKNAKKRKVILWKLHFPKLIYEGMVRKQVTPYLSEYLDFAEIIGQYKDLFFVVMPHPMFFSQTIDSGFSSDIEKLFKELKTKENVWIEKESDYRKALYYANAIIVDRSAIMVEAGLCGVPVLYMKNQDYDEPLTKPVNSLVTSYEEGTTVEDIKQFVGKFQKGMLQSVVDRIVEAKKETIPFIDGKCGKRILEDIKCGVMEEREEPLRIIFFGAGFICRHYIERLGIKNEPKVRLLGLSDNDPTKWGTIQAGLEVFPPEKLKSTEFDVLVITSEQYYMPIKKKLVYELFLAEEKIFRLDEFAEMYAAFFQ